MNRQTAVEARCVAVADTLVPNYRNGSRAYSCVGHVAKMWQAAYDGAAAVLADPLPADVRRLVIAAREVTDCGTDEDETRELLDAVEAFSSRVPYEDQPDDMADASVPDRLARRMGAEFVARDAAPPVEGLTSGEGEPVGAMLICDRTGGRMFTQWPAPERREQEADSIYGSHGGYRTVPLYAASPKATATASVREGILDRETIARTLFNQRQTTHDFDDAAEADPEGDAGTLYSIVCDDADAVIAALTDSGTAATIGGERHG